MTSPSKARSLFDPPIVRRALLDAVLKLNPRRQVRNPVMFTVFVGSILTTGLWLQSLGVFEIVIGFVRRIVMADPGIQSLSGTGQESPAFIFGVSAWLWFTVLFANFAEAMAEGRGKAQADALRATRRDVQAKQLDDPRYGAKHRPVPASQLRKDDVVLVEAGDFVPG